MEELHAGIGVVPDCRFFLIAWRCRMYCSSGVLQVGCSGNDLLECASSYSSCAAWNRAGEPAGQGSEEPGPQTLYHFRYSLSMSCHHSDS